jgi:hypothetical protein
MRSSIFVACLVINGCSSSASSVPNDSGGSHDSGAASDSGGRPQRDASGGQPMMTGTDATASGGDAARQKHDASAGDATTSSTDADRQRQDASTGDATTTSNDAGRQQRDASAGDASGGDAYRSPLVGATISNLLWPMDASMTEAIASYDGYLSADGTNRPMAAKAEKSYRQEGQYVQGILEREQEVINAGGKLIVSWEPSRTFSQTEYDNLIKEITFMQEAYTAAGMPANTFDSVLWQEASDGTAFDAGSSYQDYVDYYVGAITSTHQRLVVDMGAGKPGNWNAYFPRQAQAVLIDYYGSAWKSGTRLDAAVALATQHSLTFGIGEWNNQANSDTPLSLSDWNDYTQYLLDVFQPLAMQGKMGDVMLWMGDNPDTKTVPDQLNQLGGDCGDASPPYDPIVAIRKVYDGLTSAIAGH